LCTANVLTHELAAQSLYVNAGDDKLVMQGPDYKGAEAVKVESEQYQWLKQWYPLSVIEMLDPDRPNKVSMRSSSQLGP